MQSLLRAQTSPILRRSRCRVCCGRQIHVGSHHNRYELPVRCLSSRLPQPLVDHHNHHPYFNNGHDPQTHVHHHHYYAPPPHWTQHHHFEVSSSKPRATQRRPSLAMVAPPPIYVAATRQHVGKTTVAMALMSGLQKRWTPDRIGFMKPVGQEAVQVPDDHHSHSPQHSHQNYHQNSKFLRTVDKDVAVMRNHFGLDHLSWADMSPILIPRGYTRNYIDQLDHHLTTTHGNASSKKTKSRILQALDNTQSKSDVVLCEGTGHCGVGSIVGANNAQVAAWMQAHMVLVANYGTDDNVDACIGTTVDEIELNRQLCDHYKVPVAGVIVNRIPTTRDNTATSSIREQLDDVFERFWGAGSMPLLGCIPNNPASLQCLNVGDLQRALPKSYLLTPTTNNSHHHHFASDHVELVETSLTTFMETLRETQQRQDQKICANNCGPVFVCDATRDELLLGFVAEYQRQLRTARTTAPNIGCLIVCGTDGQELSGGLFDMLQQQPSSSSSSSTQEESHIPPILVAPHNAWQTMECLRRYTPKHHSKDRQRVENAVAHMEPHIDLDKLLTHTGHLDADGIAVTTRTTYGYEEVEDEAVAAI